jgi:hypothetical protein
VTGMRLLDEARPAPCGGELAEVQRWRRRLHVGVVLGLVGTTASASAGTWHEVAPLPEPRWMHVAACDLEGRVYAYGGYTAPVPDGRKYGVGERALDIFDPEAKAWRRGPGVKAYRARNRITRSLRCAGDIKSPPIREWVEWRDYDGRLGYEKPPGAAGRDGRIYWFGEAGPVFFDPARGVWDQAFVPVSDNAARRWLPPVPRMIRMSGVTAAAPDGRIYLVGGNGHPLNFQDRETGPGKMWQLLATMEIFDPAEGDWQERRPMPRPRQEFAGAFGADGKLYVFGGFDRRLAVHSRDFATDEEFEAAGRVVLEAAKKPLRAVDVYDPATDTWSERSPMPEGRHAMGAALGADGKIYVVGGAVSYGEPVGRREVFVYDPIADRWSEGPPLRRGRFHHGVAVDPAGSIYAVGGIVNESRHQRRGTASVEVLETAIGAPRPVPASPDRG